LIWINGPETSLFLLECGAWYEATWEQFPRQELAPGTFNCADCGTVVHSWSGIDRYSDWRLVKKVFSDPWPQVTRFPNEGAC